MIRITYKYEQIRILSKAGIIAIAIIIIIVVKYF